MSHVTNEIFVKEGLDEDEELKNLDNQVLQDVSVKQELKEEVFKEELFQSHEEFSNEDGNYSLLMNETGKGENSSNVTSNKRRKTTLTKSVRYPKRKSGQMTYSEMLPGDDDLRGASIDIRNPLPSSSQRGRGRNPHSSSLSASHAQSENSHQPFCLSQENMSQMHNEVSEGLMSSLQDSESEDAGMSGRGNGGKWLAHLCSISDNDDGYADLNSEEETSREYLSYERLGKRKLHGTTRLSSAQEVESAAWFQDNEILYNKRLPDHKDSAKKARVVARKAKELGVPADTFKIWMNSMRTRYAKIMRRLEQDPGVDLTERDKWIHNSFTFLENHIVRNPGRQSQKFPTKQEPIPRHADSEGAQSPEDEEYARSGKSGSSSAGCRPKSPSQLQQAKDYLSEIVQRIETATTSYQTPTPDERHARAVRSFLDMLQPELEEMPQEDFRRFRLTILQLLEKKA